jgi:hypothetical protein
MSVKGQGSEWGLKRGQPGAVGAGWTHRYFTLDVASPTLRLVMPRGGVFVGVPFTTEAIKVSVMNKGDEESLDPERAVSVAAEGALASRPVQNGEVLLIEHDDGETDIGVITLVLEGKDLPASLSEILSIATTALPNGTAEAAYDQDIETAGGVGTVVLSMTGTLPGGLTFTDNTDGTATIDGTLDMATEGEYVIIVHAVDDNGITVNRTIVLTIDAA